MRAHLDFIIHHFKDFVKIKTAYIDCGGVLPDDRSRLLPAVSQRVHQRAHHAEDMLFDVRFDELRWNHLTSFCLLAVTFCDAKLQKQPIYILKECFTHFPTRPSSSILKNEMLTKLWFKVWSSVAHSFVDPEKRFRNLFHPEQLEKVEFPFRFTISLEMGIKFSQWNRFLWFTGRFSLIHSVPGEWLSIIVARAACVPVNSVSATRPLPRPCARSLPLPTDLLAQRTCLPRRQCRPRLQTPRTYLPLRAPPRTHTWSSPSSPSSSRTSHCSILLRSRPLCR